MPDSVEQQRKKAHAYLKPFLFNPINYVFTRCIDGPGSIVYALSKLDDHLQHEESKVVRELLATVPYGDLAICAFFLRENVDETVANAYAFGLRRMADKRIEINKQTKKRFVNILLRVARAHDGISRAERSFIRQFWREIRSL